MMQSTYLHFALGSGRITILQMITEPSACQWFMLYNRQPHNKTLLMGRGYITKLWIASDSISCEYLSDIYDMVASGT